MNPKENLAALRKLMSEHTIDAYIIPMTDAHLSEYVANHWRSIKWFSGFSGSAGTIVVTQHFAGLWTDSRYFIQAEEQLKDSGIELVKLLVPHTPEYINWINVELPTYSKIAFDAKVFQVGLVQKMESVFKRKSFNIVGDYDFINELWKYRPEIPANKIFIHDLKYAGKSSKEKVAELNIKMSEQSIDYHLLSSLDDIAWLFNIRGNDIDYNPLAVSYALVSANKAILYINEEKLTSEVKQKLIDDGVTIKPYDEVYDDLKKLEGGKSVFSQLSKTNFALYNSISKDCFIIDEINITSFLKAQKNEIEADHIRETMIKDGVAMVKFLHWLELNVGKEKITEISAAEKLKTFREEQVGFVGESFGTISGYKGHGAMPHYSATKETDLELKTEGLYLVDSGGQYFGGTTDITRTITLGKLTEEEKRDFTLALRGTIDLAMAVFPYGTKGVQLDAFARKALWDNHMNYGHGTGHGVGFFLNVHEGPQSISPNAANDKTNVLEVGMLLSDEPAFYRKDKHGIRIENLMLVVEDKENEFGRFLKFESVTLCPIDTKPIDVNLLTIDEKNWLNDYHKDVYKKISPFLDTDLKDWLKEKTMFV